MPATSKGDARTDMTILTGWAPVHPADSSVKVVKVDEDSVLHERGNRGPRGWIVIVDEYLSAWAMGTRLAVHAFPLELGR